MNKQKPSEMFPKEIIGSPEVIEKVAEIKKLLDELILSLPPKS